MSDKWNQTPGSDPADDQPGRPQESGPGRPPAGQGPGPGHGPGQSQDQGQGQGPNRGWFEARNEEGGPVAGEPSHSNQPASWWSGDSDAKREFSSPTPAEQPANNWFDGGWDPTRREHPDQPGPAQSGPAQSGPSHSGPAQHGPAQHGPAQHGPAQTNPWQSGPAQPRPGQAGQGQAGPGQAGPGQAGPGQGGQAQGGSWQSGPMPPAQSGGSWQSNPQQQSPQQPSAPHSNPQQSGSSAWQAAPQQQPPKQQSGPHSENSYLWGPQGDQNQQNQQQSPWSNALPPQQQQQHQQGGRHAAPQSGGPNQGPQIGPMGQPVQQAPTWQYPPIPIPQPPGGRRRRKKKVSRNLLIGIVALAVLVVGSGVTLAVRALGSDDPEAKQTPTAPASETPSQTPSESPSPSTPRGPTVDEVVTSSRLYTVGPVTASKCVEPPFAPVTVAAARQYYGRLLPCMNRTWWLAMKKVNLPFRLAKSVVYVGKIPSPCGIQRGVRASYCAANETIYLPFAVDNGAYTRDPIHARALMLNTFAHEYGHHVQKLAGILPASMTRAQRMSPNQKLLESRRRELQATCLGAVYLGANATFIPMNGVLLAKWKVLITHLGDDYSRPRVHDHGNRVSNYQWTIAGYNNKKPDSCNTFTAAEVRVN